MPFLSADRLNGLRGVAPIDQLQVPTAIPLFHFCHGHVGVESPFNCVLSDALPQTDAESARKDLQRTLRAVSQVVLIRDSARVCHLNVLCSDEKRLFRAQTR